MVLLVVFSCTQMYTIIIKHLEPQQAVQLAKIPNVDRDAHVLAAHFRRSGWLTNGNLSDRR
jgi:hypothetical protein